MATYTSTIKKNVVAPTELKPNAVSEAIAEFKILFPEDQRLQCTSNEEIEKMVNVFMQDPRQIHLVPQISSVNFAATSMMGIPPCVLASSAVIVDVIFMVLGFVGLHVSANEAANRAVMRLLGQETLGGFQRLFYTLGQADTILAKSKAIFNIAGAAYNAGMFRAVLGAIKDSMEWWDWVIIGVTAVAQIAALFLTDGAAFIAEIALNATAVAFVASDSVKAVQACS